MKAKQCRRSRPHVVVTPEHHEKIVEIAKEKDEKVQSVVKRLLGRGLNGESK